MSPVSRRFVTILISPSASTSSKNALAAASSSIRSMRISVDRIAREMNEAAMVAKMNVDAIFMPSGRSMMLATVVYAKTADISQNAHVQRLPRRRDERDTAIAADDIKTRTPVAYAPPWASTSALNTQVTVKQIAVKTRT